MRTLGTLLPVLLQVHPIYVSLKVAIEHGRIIALLTRQPRQFFRVVNASYALSKAVREARFVVADVAFLNHAVPYELWRCEWSGTLAFETPGHKCCTCLSNRRYLMAEAEAPSFTLKSRPNDKLVNNDLASC